MAAVLWLALWCSSVAPAQDAASPQAPPVALSEALRTDWGARPPWNDGLWEIAEYRARVVRGGDVQERTVLVVTGPEDFSRESLARAQWPYGARPVVEGMRQRTLWLPAEGVWPGASLVDVWTDRRIAARLLRLQVAEIAPAGALSRDFDFTGAPPTERYSSPRDVEGTGARPIDTPQEALFEEQLPLVLRALRFEQGARAWCSLMEPVADGGAARPRSSPAVLTVERSPQPPPLPVRTWQGEAPWRVTIEAADGRRIECLVAAEPAHTLLSLEHSNGSGLVLSSVRRGVFRD